MKEVSIHVGQRIRLYRKTKNLTIETFAGMIHKSKATVSKYENGDISIDIETLFTIAQALGVPVNQLIDYEEIGEQLKKLGDIIEDSQKGLWNITEQKMLDIEKEIATCESALCEAGKIIGDIPVMIDHTFHPRPLGLAKLLLTHGFHVTRIYLDAVSPEEKEVAEWLQKECESLSKVRKKEAKLLQAKIAEAAGACAVMALERIPADIRAAGGVSRMSDPKMIKGIQEAVSIPVMAKCRIGHFVEAQLLQAIEIDYIDESEVLSPADDVYHIDKTQFQVPFVCGARDLGEALRRINEGASMIRTKGEPGTGDVVQAVRHMRKMNADIRRITSMRTDELFEEAKQLQVPYELVLYVHENGKLPVVNFAAGGVATPADAALMMQLGAEGVFVGSGIFKSGNPEKRANAIVKAVTNYTDAKMIAKLSEDLGEAMVGINESEIQLLMAERGK